MSDLQHLLCNVLLCIALVVGGWLGIHHYGDEQYKAGQAAAVAAGKAESDRIAAANRKTESDLRAQMRTKDADALELERTYEISLDVAERRLRTGTDRLRCPASPVPAAAAPGDRPAAAGPDPDAERPAIVPETAADLLGIGADVAGLVRKFDRLNERFEACRAVNAQ